MDTLESRLEDTLSVTGSEIAALYDVADRSETISVIKVFLFVAELATRP